MNILALCVLSSDEPTEEANLKEEHLSAIRKRYPNTSVEQAMIASMENMEFKFKKSVDLCRKENLRMVCKESHRLTSSEECMLYLKEKPIHFDFLDFPALQWGPTLEAIIGLLHQQKIFRSENIKQGIKKSKKKMGNPRLKDSNAIKHASEERQRKSWINLNNFYARKEIIKLKTLQNLSFTKIAEQLNSKGLKTRRGNHFHTKSVIRLYESYELFKTSKSQLFGNHPKLMTFDQGLRNLQSPDNHLQIINWLEQTPNFKSDIFLQLKSPTNFDIETTIYNNKNIIVYQKTFPKGQKEININVEKTNKLSPGRHYIKIEAPDSNLITCFRSFDLFRDMIEVEAER